MEPTFWESRWQAQQIGFHLAEVNQSLARWWPTLAVAADARVLVPLCGKSLDLVWLHERGHRVVGAELSPIACAAFFADNDLPCRQETHGAHTRWIGVAAADGLEIVQGDFFSAPTSLFAGVDALYDRASLIALPPALRPRHAAQLRRLVPSGGRGLVVTLDYPQAEKLGPPFSVPTAEVDAQLGAAFTVRLRNTSDLLATPGAEARWGLSRLAELVHDVSRR